MSGRTTAESGEPSESGVQSRKVAWIPVLATRTRPVDVLSIPGRREKGELVGFDQTSAPRVLQCFGGMELGGAETFAMHVYRSVDRSRIQFDFAVSAENGCYYDEEIRSLGGRIVRHAAPSTAGLLRYGRELKTILR